MAHKWSEWAYALSKIHQNSTKTSLGRVLEWLGIPFWPLLTISKHFPPIWPQICSHLLLADWNRVLKPYSVIILMPTPSDYIHNGIHTMDKLRKEWFFCCFRVTHRLLPRCCGYILWYLFLSHYPHLCLLPKPLGGPSPNTISVAAPVYGTWFFLV